MSAILFNEIFRPIKKARVLIDGIWRNLYEAKILINEEWHRFELGDSRIRFHDFWEDAIWSKDDNWGRLPVDFWADDTQWFSDIHWSQLFRDDFNKSDDNLTGDDIWDASFEKKVTSDRVEYIPVDPIDSWGNIEDIWMDNDIWKV